MNLQEIRAKYPQYDNISDDILTKKLHDKFYPQMDINEFNQKIGYKKQPTESDIESAKQKALEINKQMGIVNDDGSVKGSWVNSGWIRKPVAVMKGVADSNMNPASIVTKGINYIRKGEYALPESMNGFQSQTAGERALERGAKQANDYATMAILGNALGSTGALGVGNGFASKLARGAFMGSPVESAITGFGGGSLSGAVNSSDPVLDFALNVAGGSTANAIQGGAKNIFKHVKDARLSPKEITEETFKDALGNKQSVKRMTTAIQSGNEDLQQRAGQFVEKMSAYKASKGHADIPFAEGGSGQLKDAIKLPEYKKAQEAYNVFKIKHSGDKISSSAMNEFYKNNPFAKETMKDVMKNTPQITKANMNTIGSVDQLKSQLSRIATSNSDKARYAFKASQDLKTLMDNTSSGFRSVNQAFAKAATKQKDYENLLFSNAKKVANATKSPASQITGMSASGAILGGLMAHNPAAVMAGLGIVGARELNRGLRREAGNAVARGATPLLDTINNTLMNYGVKGTQKAGLQTIIEKALNKKGE